MSRELFKPPPDERPGPDRAPLAERMRPGEVSLFVGQEHLLAPGRGLRTLLETGRPASMVFWGPPGTGKTTLARLLAGHWQAHFTEFSAVLSGVGEVRRETAEARRRLDRGRPTVLFVDEIHRFNKAQQDAFLPHVESGVITLLGATTENPSFEIIPALLSRLSVHVLKPLDESHLMLILDRALTDEEHGMAGWNPKLAPEARDHLVATSFGDARRLLGSLEMAVQLAPMGEGGVRLVGLPQAEEAVGRAALRYDKAGEEHYNLISALHKSMRGSDPDASLYWLARMLEAGEDPRYVLRRLLRFASEDVGLADPFALNQVSAAFAAYEVQGMPEGALALAQAVVYLSLAPKSNSLYKGYGAARADADKYGPLAPPKHILNAPTRLMKDLGYGRGYEYPHDHEGAVVDADYMPGKLSGRKYYRPGNQGRERQFTQWMAERARRKQALRSKSSKPEPKKDE